MDPFEWKLLIVQSLERLGSEDYQRSAWFGGEQEISSPEEMICELVDDFRIKEFLKQHGDLLAPEAQQMLGHLIENLNAIAIILPDQPSPSKVIDDQNWIKIRKMAIRLASLMRIGV